MIRAGRPPKPISWKIFEKLCYIQCTIAELASVLEICEDTLYDRVQKEYGEHFAVVYKRFAAGGKSSLRRYQFDMAKKSATMAIWLGKQYLNQKDISREEMQDMLEELKDAVRDSEESPGVAQDQRPVLEDQQSLPYPHVAGAEDKVCSKLGTETAV